MFAQSKPLAGFLLLEQMQELIGIALPRIIIIVLAAHGNNATALWLLQQRQVQ